MIRKNKLFFLVCTVIIFAILILTIRFFFYQSEFYKTLKSGAQYQPSLVFKPNLLDSRFLLLYGYISNIDKNTIIIDVIKSPNLTDYVFNNQKNISISLSSSTILKKFDAGKNVYKTLDITNLKIGDFSTIYIDKATSSGYKAIGIKVYDKDITSI